MTELEKYILSYFGVPLDDIAKINAFFKPVHLQKGDYFLRTGRQADRLGFVQSGIIREYLYVDDKEVTKWISTKGYFVVDLSSFVFKQPARWNIQALTDCTLWVIDSNDYQRLGELIPGWAALEKIIHRQMFYGAGRQDRFTSFHDCRRTVYTTLSIQSGSL
jgi:CRP-like cAMP-binding protein